MELRSLFLLLPELFLVLTLLSVVISEITYHEEKTRLLKLISLIGLGGAFLETLGLLSVQSVPVFVFSRTWVVDGQALFFKLYFILLTGITVFISPLDEELNGKRQAESFALLIAACLAMCAVVSSAHLVLLFLTLQMINVLAYLLVSSGKKRALSVEAGVKFSVAGTLSSGFLLYGVSVLFILTKTLYLYEMQSVLHIGMVGKEIGFVVFFLLMISLCFQMGAFPMCFWMPDLIEGAPTILSGFLSLGTRVSGVAVALRVLFVLFARPTEWAGKWNIIGDFNWTNMLVVMSGLTLFIGSFLAIRQNKAKRLVSYLVIAETGFLLIGVLVLEKAGVVSLLYLLITELFSLMGVFSCLSYLISRAKTDSLSNIGKTVENIMPEAVFLVLFLLCFIGFPPFPGFIGKFSLLETAVEKGCYFLAFFAVIALGLETAAVAKLGLSLLGNLDGVVVRSAGTHKRGIMIFLLFIPLISVCLFADRIFHWLDHIVQ